MKYIIKLTDKLTNEVYCISYMDVQLRCTLDLVYSCYPFNTKEDATNFINNDLLDNTDYNFEDYIINIAEVDYTC